MAGDISPVLVQASFSFKGSNNDELCFSKGDIISVTQVEEDGWWEGTLDGKTGWFPSNYVKEYKTSDVVPVPPTAAKLPAEFTSQQKVFRNLVLKDIVESEKAHVTELHTFMKNFVIPLKESDILSASEFRQLTMNLEEVVSFHDRLLASVEECYQSSSPQLQRVGKSFLTKAPQIKQIYMQYCAHHPKAVCIIEKFRDELNGFMESHGAHSPGIMVLTVGLSKPFRRLEKYSGMLQELERHMAENHVDRGDTQRSVQVYKDIASSCSGIRRQKEMELEVVSGGVKGWEGEPLSQLGEVLHMGSVAVGEQRQDRYFVLFPSTLLLLSVSPRMSAFIYEGKLPLSGITVNKLEDADATKNAFEITGTMIDRIVAVCQTKGDQQKWLELLRLQIGQSRVTPASSGTSSYQSSQLTLSNQEMKSPFHLPNNRVPSTSMLKLRPAPPIKPQLCRDDNQRNKNNWITKANGGEKGFEDTEILRVIEAYCTSAKTRYTINSAYLDSPQILIAEEEKIINEEISGNHTIVEEKSLVDTVYALKDQVKDLKTQMGSLSQKVDDERKLRLNLQNLVRTHLLPNVEAMVWEE